jgi:nitrite reductase/ring-hydroxylating ferredoxin subunit
MNYSKVDPSECEFYEVAEVEELPNGERIFIEIGDNYMVIFNIAGQYYAIEDLCSHDDGPLGDGDVEGYEVICPRHGARFDLRTGKALTLPAVEDIPAYPIRVVDERILVGVPKS